MLTEEEDRQLRDYAKRLHRELGEDAYHIVVCEVIARGGVERIKNMVSYIRVSIRWALYKLFKHEHVEKVNIIAWMRNDPVPMQRGLVGGRKKRMMCRKGMHALIEGNLAYVGVQRTCRMCKREREARGGRNRRQLLREAI